MKNFIKISLGFMTGFIALLGTIGGTIAVKYWVVTLVILSILNLSGLVIMPWFAGITVLSAIGTPLFMLGVGILMVLFNLMVLGIISEIFE